MVPWALDEEVLHGHRRRHDLGSNSRIAWHQRAVRQGWPVAPDRRVKPFRPCWIDGVIDGIDPFHVRAKPGLPGEVNDGQYFPDGDWEQGANTIFTPLAVGDRLGVPAASSSTGSYLHPDGHSK